MKETVLITGASSGIGWEFARVFAREGYNLVLTARRENRLVQLKEMIGQEFDVKVTSIVEDLSKEGSAERIFDKVKDLNISIDVLVNNAGFGIFGKFARRDINQMTDMVQVNITALMQLTRLFLDGMMERRHGHILNVASVAGFAPGPLMSVYYASKAFVVSFSEALANELEKTGVYVTIFCPGPVKSEFKAICYREDPSLEDNRKVPTSAQAAQRGYDAMRRKKLLVIPGLFNKCASFFVRFFPRSIVPKVVRRMQNSRGEQ